MSLVFEEFMKKVGAYPKLKFEENGKTPKELIFVKAEHTEKMNPKGEMKPAIKIIVRDRSDGEIKEWKTESVVVADSLRGIEPKMLFTVMPTKNGAKKGYKIEIKGFVEDENG